MIERELKASHTNETLQANEIRLFDESRNPLALDGVLEITEFTDGFIIATCIKLNEEGVPIVSETNTPCFKFCMGYMRMEITPKATLTGEPTS